MNTDKLIAFIRNNKMLKISEIERQAGIPNSSLSKAVGGFQPLKKDYIAKVEAVLEKFGLYDEAETRVISIINNKGGVGKTTTACNLGKALALKGKKVLVIDMDPQGNLSQYMDCVDPEVELVDILLERLKDYNEAIVNYSDNMDLIPSSIDLDRATLELQKQPLGGYKKLDNALKPIVGDYDYVLIDCPPSLSILTAASLVAATDVLIPINPAQFSISGITNIMDLVEDAKTLNPQLSVLGFVFTSAKPNTVIHRDIMQDFRNNIKGEKVFDAIIHHTIAFEESTNVRLNIFDYAPNSKGADDYMSLAEEILN